MNKAILREVSFQVSRGNPIWGVSLANEYLETRCPLRQGLVARARTTLRLRGLSESKLFTLLASGSVLSELPETLRNELGQRAFQCGQSHTNTSLAESITTRRWCGRRRIGKRLRREIDRSMQRSFWQKANR